MSRVLFLFALVSCGGDPLPPELREVVPCIEGEDGGSRCERACLLPFDKEDDGATCRFTSGRGLDLACTYVGSYIVNIDGARGCCMFDPEDATRWYECE